MLRPNEAGDLRVALLTSRRAPGLDRLLARSGRPGAGWRLVGAVASDPASAALPLLAAARVPAAVHDFGWFCAERRVRPGTRGSWSRDRGARREYDRRTQAILAPWRPDLVVLCGWLWIVTEPLLEAYPGRAINVHDSDLAIAGPDGRPRYRGLRATRDAIAAGEPETRSTVHIVTEEIDVGPPLVRSWSFPVHPMVVDARAWDARDVLSAYAYAQREWMMRASWGRLLEHAIVRHARGEVRLLDGKAVLGGVLGPDELAPGPAPRVLPAAASAGGR
jgi:folate-dependent phosphoribosylglycinamide formyltransferase PurN